MSDETTNELECQQGAARGTTKAVWFERVGLESVP